MTLPLSYSSSGSYSTTSTTSAAKRPSLQFTSQSPASQETPFSLSQAKFLHQSSDLSSAPSILPIGKRKLGAFRDFLSFKYTTSPFFILAGPSGTGKWTCAKALALQFGFHPLIEYEAQCFFDHDSREPLSSYFDNFSQFVLSAFTNNASQSNCKGPLLVVREFPNLWEGAGVGMRSKFFALQQRCLKLWEKGLRCSPIVFIVSDAFNGVRDHVEFFCSEFRNSPLVGICTVGEVSEPMLRRILSASFPALSNVESVVQASGGDLRYALTLGNLFPLSGLSPSIAPVFERDCSLGLFHALGKIFYKRKEFALFDFASSTNSNSPGGIWGFVGFLEQNIYDHYDSIEVISQFMQLLSVADSCARVVGGGGCGVRGEENCFQVLPAFYLQRVCEEPLVLSYKPFKKPVWNRGRCK